MRRITTKKVTQLIIVFLSQFWELVTVLVEDASVSGEGVNVAAGREVVREVMMMEEGTDVKLVIMRIDEGTGIVLLVGRLTVVAGDDTARISRDEMQ